MFGVVLFTGLAWGMLLAAIGIALWGGLQGDRELSLSARVPAWIAAAILVFGSLLGWGSKLPALKSLVGSLEATDLPGPMLSAILMAALAVPMKTEAEKEALWSQALVYLPAFALTTIALVQVSRPAGVGAGTNWVTPTRFSIAVCAGVGARALGQSWRVMAAGVSPAQWPSELTYGLLTLISGFAALWSLWRQGVMWPSVDPVMRGGVAGAWLAWSAVWLAPPRYWRARGILTSLAAGLLVSVAMR